MRRRDRQPTAPPPALLLTFALALAFALACGGLVPSGGGGDEVDLSRASGLAVGDPALDEAIDEAVRRQEARDAMVDDLKQGAVPSRTSDVDEAWRVVFGESGSNPPRRRR